MMRRRIFVGRLLSELGSSVAAARDEIPSEYRITAQELTNAQERLRRAEQHVQQIKEEVTPSVIDAASHYVRKVAGELKSKRREYRVAGFKYRICQLFRSPALQTLALVIVAVMILAMFLVTYNLISTSLLVLVTFIACVLTVATFVISKATFDPSEGNVAAAHERWRKAQEELPSLETRFAALRVRFDRLVRDRSWLVEHAKAMKAYDDLCRIAESQAYKLLHTDWRSLRGGPFEDFVGDVFEMLGYQIKKTKASGDQGIDVIAKGKGRVIGIQCKGYCDSVGNHAVQEAYAGKRFYQCDSCLVITNSLFTKAAIDLAANVGCELIAGNKMVSLITGRLY